MLPRRSPVTESYGHSGAADADERGIHAPPTRVVGMKHHVLVVRPDVHAARGYETMAVAGREQWSRGARVGPCDAGCGRVRDGVGVCDEAAAAEEQDVGAGAGADEVGRFDDALV